MARIVDRDEKRAALVQAALSVFAERGFHRSTMQAVADRAGVSKGSVYAYFASKEDLFHSTVETLVGALVERTISVLESSHGPIRQRVEAFVRSVIDNIADWTEVYMSFLQVWAELGSEDDERLRALMADFYKRSADRIAGVFDEAVVREEASPFPTRAAALALIATLDGVILQAVMVRDEFRKAIATDLLAHWCAALVPLPSQTETQRG